MTPGELRAKVSAAGEIYKMSLGRTAEYEQEALLAGCLVLGSEARFHAAVVEGDKAGIQTTGRRIKNDGYPTGGAAVEAIGIWKRTIQTFRALPPGALVLHWEAERDRLCWGLTDGGSAWPGRRPVNGASRSSCSTCP